MGIEDRLVEALDELVSAIEDGWRRHNVGDSEAICSTMINVTVKQAKALLAEVKER